MFLKVVTKQRALNIWHMWFDFLYQVTELCCHKLLALMTSQAQTQRKPLLLMSWWYSPQKSTIVFKYPEASVWVWSCSYCWRMISFPFSFFGKWKLCKNHPTVLNVYLYNVCEPSAVFSDNECNKLCIILQRPLHFPAKQHWNTLSKFLWVRTKYK